MERCVVIMVAIRNGSYLKLQLSIIEVLALMYLAIMFQLLYASLGIVNDHEFRPHHRGLGGDHEVVGHLVPAKRRPLWPR
jgi:hypothetical protein